MVHRMSYFRVKRLRLGASYGRFLSERLAPGGTIFVVDCTLRWPTTRIGDRHIFQFGAWGGASLDDLFNGGRRTEEYLQRYGSRRKRWSPPSPDAGRSAVYGPELLVAAPWVHQALFVSRNGELLTTNDDGTTWVHVGTPGEMRALGVSSSQVRERVKAGRPIDHLVPAHVAEAIHNNRLYL